MKMGVDRPWPKKNKTTSEGLGKWGLLGQIRIHYSYGILELYTIVVDYTRYYTRYLINIPDDWLILIDIGYNVGKAMS